MTKLTLIFALGLATVAGPTLAGDAAVGEDTFKKCKACHSIIGDDGTEFQKGGKTGPNLYGVVGRPVGSVAGFNYGASILAVGATGAVWDEASIAAYVVNPAAWLAEKTGDPAAKSKMSFKLAAGGEDVAAYLASVK
jgi:cytochrome c